MDIITILVLIISGILILVLKLDSNYLLTLPGFYYIYIGICAFLNKPNWNLKRSIKYTEKKYIIDNRKKYLRLEGIFHLITGFLLVFYPYSAKYFAVGTYFIFVIVILSILLLFYYICLRMILERKNS
jgi:hypothetical protein